MNPGFEFKHYDLPRVLFWMGAALIGMFAVTVVSGMFPLGLLLPAWQEQFCGTILAYSSYAGIGAIMILLAHRLDDHSDELGRWVTRLRLLAIPAAIGFFLLLPLQSHATYKLLRAAYVQDRQPIGQLQKVLVAIESAKSDEDLLAALSKVPGAPDNLSKITIPFPQAKQILTERLIGQIKKVENLSEEQNAARWQQSLANWARNCFIFLCFGAAFAEIAKYPNSPNTFLFSILRSLRLNKQIRRTTQY